MSADKSKNPVPHFIGSGLAALINFPLWKASAIAQSGFKVEAAGWGAAYVKALAPPWNGALAVVAGMTWARAAIFYGSEIGRPVLQQMLGEEKPSLISMAIPPVFMSTIVQIINQPLVRGSVQLQDPRTPPGRTVLQALQTIFKERGLSGLWHGTLAGILKTVPKYCVAVVIKDTLEEHLPRPRPGNELTSLARSALKACTAATAGALLTNPLDVIRNEMFKTNLSMTDTIKVLNKNYPNFSWFMRGAEKNLIAVAVPVACTIFFTEQLARLPLFAS